MNWLDVIIIVPLLWALYNGYRKGIIPQVGYIAGIAVGVLLAYYLGSAVTSWMNVNTTAGKVVIYIVVAGVALFGVLVAARMVSEAFRSAGLGIFDRIGGAVLGLVKVWLVICVALLAFQWLDRKNNILGDPTLDGSLLYYPVLNSADYLFPYMDRARDQIEEWDRQDDQRVDE